MIKEIVTDTNFLSKKCEPCAEGEDIQEVICDLMDTAKEHFERCAGLAANQVGHLKRIILIRFNDVFTPYINPEIIFTGGGTSYDGETCLSRPGEDSIFKTRYKKIKIEHDVEGRRVKSTFRQFPARVVQHEIDHLNGILI